MPPGNGNCAGENLQIPLEPKANIPRTNGTVGHSGSITATEEASPEPSQREAIRNPLIWGQLENTPRAT